MNKEFIPFELALEMFNIGFDEPCEKFQWIDQDKPKWMGETNSPSKLHRQKYWIENNDLYTISIPSFSQCFRWFREKYHIIGEVKFKGGLTTKTAWYNYVIYSQIDWEDDNPNEQWKTYEEAELACLKKLIEIVKEK